MDSQRPEKDPAAPSQAPSSPSTSPQDPAANGSEAEGQPGPVGRGKGASSPHVWVASTYFAEGYPFGIIHSIVDVMYKEFGASNQTIGLTALFHLPWNLKFLWGPFLDAYATKRSWLIWTEVALSALVVGLAVIASIKTVLFWATIIFLVMAFIAATHDIAIDGYYLEALDKKGQSQFVGYRAMAYRIAQGVVTGPIIAAIDQLGWNAGLAIAAGIMLLLLGYHSTLLPKAEAQRKPIGDLVRSAVRLPVLLTTIGIAVAVLVLRELVLSNPVQSAWAGLMAVAPILAKISLAEWIGLALLAAILVLLAMLGPIRRRIGGSDSFYARAYVDFLAQPLIGRLLAFVILFRAGESFLLKMRYTFLADIGVTKSEFAFASTTSLIASFVATLLGGQLISRHGLRTWIWPFILAANVLNLLYAGMAWYYPVVSAGGAGPDPMVVTVLMAIEAFGAGLGTAVLMVYIMRGCRPEFKAAHMAILTALMSVCSTLAGVSSGFIQSWMGYALFFAFTFLATIPSMALIPFIPNVDAAPADKKGGPAT